MDTQIPNWDDYFMAIAKSVASRSKDPSTKVGAVLVDSNKHIVGTGYNGMPEGMVETPELWQRPEKYEWVIHAEANCLMHSTAAKQNCTLYTTMFPCADCAKLISSAKLKRVVYLDDKYWNDKSCLILRPSGVGLVHHT